MSHSSTRSTELAGLRRVAVERLKWGRGLSLGLLAGMSDAQLLTRVGGKGNHAIWVMGHLAHTEDTILLMLAGQPRELPTEYEHLFGGSREPTENSSDYPPRDALLAAMAATRARTIAWVESLDVSTAFEPTPEALRRLSPDRITTPFGIVAHEMLHGGQVAAVRSYVGLPRLLG